MWRSIADSNGRLCCEFWPNWVVKLNDPPQQLPAVIRHAPAATARDLGHQMADVESFQQAPHRRARSALVGRLEEPPKQRLADVAVAKASRDVIAIQDCPEQPHVVPARWVETCVAPPFDELGLDQLPQSRVGWRRI